MRKSSLSVYLWGVLYCEYIGQVSKKVLAHLQYPSTTMLHVPTAYLVKTANLLCVLPEV